MTRQGLRGGFTLIELLVVIAIIAILASILFPVFARAREKARESACMSNLRQIGLALRMYSDDHDELLPMAADFPTAGPIPTTSDVSLGGVSLRDVLHPYTKNNQIFRCPSDKDKFWEVEGLSYSYCSGAFEFYASPMEPPDISPTAFSLVYDYSPDWHSKGPNVLYADGHVKVSRR